MIRKLQNHSNQFDLVSGPWFFRQQPLAMVPTSQKKRISALINFPGRRPPREWEQSAVPRKAKSTARLQRSTSASLTVSAPPITTRTELASNPANALSPMRDQLPPMLEHARQTRLSPKQSPRPRFPRPRFPRPRFPRPCIPCPRFLRPRRPTLPHHSPCPCHSTRLIPNTRTIPIISIPICLNLHIPILRDRLLIVPRSLLSLLTLTHIRLR